MTAAQRKKLEAIRNRLVDVAIEESDPAGWINEERAAERAAALEEVGEVKDAVKVRLGWKGERYWEKKNANQTIALILRVDELLGEEAGAGKLGADEKKAIKDAEARVSERIKARTRPQLVVNNAGKG